MAVPLRLPPLEQFIPRHMTAMSVAAELAELSRDVVDALIVDVRSALRAHEDERGGRVPFAIHLARAQSPTET